MDSGIRCRAYPTNAQAKTLAQWIGCQRFIQNAKVEESDYFLRFRNRSLALTSWFV
jgi:putative transposase